MIWSFHTRRSMWETLAVSLLAHWHGLIYRRWGLLSHFFYLSLSFFPFQKDRQVLNVHAKVKSVFLCEWESRPKCVWGPIRCPDGIVYSVVWFLRAVTAPWVSPLGDEEEASRAWCCHSVWSAQPISSTHDSASDS